jgi:predicted helicase
MQSENTAADLFFHIVAILHSPTYRTENQGALRQDWPRIPLPATAQPIKASAQLGREIAALLDTECKVKGVSEARRGVALAKEII